MNFLRKYKSEIITIIIIICLLQFIAYTLYDHITKWKPAIDTNTAVNYPELRKKFGNWFDFFFLTDHTLIMFMIVGSFYHWGRKNNIYQTIFFATISYLIFNLFAMTHFKWESISVEPYGSYRTLSSHLVIPLIGFAILFIIRKEILLNWNGLIGMSFYLLFFLIQTITIYYAATYINDQGKIENIKIYEFFDFNHKVMIFKITNIYSKIFINSIIFLISPFAGMGIFMVFKFLFNIPCSKWMYYRKNSL